VDKTHRIYAPRPGPPRPALSWVRREVDGSADGASPEAAERVPASREIELGREADRVLLANYAPAGVIVNKDLDVLHVRGHTGPHLELSSGVASVNLLKMLREGLLVDVRAMVRRARSTGTPARRDGAQMRRDGCLVRVDITVIPLRSLAARGGTSGVFLVLFEDSSSVAESVRKRKGGGRPKLTSEERPTQALRAELESTKEYLQTIISEREAANEELKSASEELQSTNEEMQSTNEELETSKEELQSVNEELATVNDELQARNAELGRLNSDFINILSSVTIPIVIVGSDLGTRRFTGMAERVLNVVPTDVGRSILDIRWKVDLQDVDRVLRDVIETLTPWQRDIPSQDGHWFSVRVTPYRSTDDRIDGAVLAFIDVDARRKVESEIQRRSDEFERVGVMKDEFLALLSHELRTPLSAMLGWVRLLRSGSSIRNGPRMPWRSSSVTWRCRRGSSRTCWTSRESLPASYTSSLDRWRFVTWPRPPSTFVCSPSCRRRTGRSRKLTRRCHTHPRSSGRAPPTDGSHAPAPARAWRANLSALAGLDSVDRVGKGASVPRSSRAAPQPPRHPVGAVVRQPPSDPDRAALWGSYMGDLPASRPQSKGESQAPTLEWSEPMGWPVGWTWQ
jgi:flagellar motility protein MotE (MotC chaperone)